MYNIYIIRLIIMTDIILIKFEIPSETLNVLV